MFSVVVPTFNRAGPLRGTLESLLAQETDVPFEVLVVDNNSRDGTRSIVEARAHQVPEKLRYIFEGTQGLSHAKNAGAAAARGEVFVFVDDDIKAHPGWLQALASTYNAYPDAWCVGGKIMVGLPEIQPSWFDSSAEIILGCLGRFDHGDAVVRLEYPEAPYGGNFSLRREAFAHAGGFNTRLGRVGPRLLSGEDVELCFRVHRAGGGIYYCGQAVVTHLVPISRLTKRFFRQRMYWQGRTERLYFPHDERWSSPGRLGAEALVMTKDWVKTLVFYGAGDGRRAFRHEIAAWKHLGYLHHCILPRKLKAIAPEDAVCPAIR